MTYYYFVYINNKKSSATCRIYKSLNPNKGANPTSPGSIM